MLMAIPISYLITSFPILFVLIKGLIIRVYDQIDIKTTDSLTTAYTIGTILMYIDNSINILFYVVFGKTLRHDFIKILPSTLRSCFVKQV